MPKIKKLSPELMDELVHLVKYSTEPISQIVGNVYRKHPESRKHAIQKDSESKKKTIAYIKAIVERVRSMIKPYANKRCPECGGCLATRRCLVCDLNKNIVRETA